jgi:hypothetical protein
VGIGALPPCVGGGIVFPRVGHRIPAWCASRGKIESAEDVHLAVERSDRRVMHGMRHGFLLGPCVTAGIVFVHQSGGLEAGQQSLRSDKLSVD